MATYTTKFRPGDRVMVTDRFGGGRFGGVVDYISIDANSCSYWVKVKSGGVSAYREDDLILDLTPPQTLANGDRVLVKFEGLVVQSNGGDWVVVEESSSGKTITIPSHVLSPKT